MSKRVKDTYGDAVEVEMSGTRDKIVLTVTPDLSITDDDHKCFVFSVEQATELIRALQETISLIKK